MKIFIGLLFVMLQASGYFAQVTPVGLGGTCTLNEECTKPPGKAYCKGLDEGTVGTCDCYEEWFVKTSKIPDNGRYRCARKTCEEGTVKICSECPQHFYKNNKHCRACLPGLGTMAAGMTSNATCIDMGKIPVTPKLQCYDEQTCNTCFEDVLAALDTDTCTWINTANNGTCLAECPSPYAMAVHLIYFPSIATTAPITDYATLYNAVKAGCPPAPASTTTTSTTTTDTTTTDTTTTDTTTTSTTTTTTMGSP